MDKIEANRERVRRYRSKNKRIDYSPAPDVAAIIAAHLKDGRDNCSAGVIDALIRLGHRAVTGNAGR